MDKFVPFLPAVCIFAGMGFTVFVLALSKAAARADEWMDQIVVEPPETGEHLGV